MKGTYVVVLRRTGFSTLFAVGTRAQCMKKAAELNTAYQTDEYRVEEWRDDA